MTSIEQLPSRLAGAVDRIPESMSLLAGPASGVVILPFHLAWSGPTDFNVDDPKERLTLYRTLMDCGQRHDIIQYINAEHLRLDWPRVKRLTSRRLVHLWERRLPELAVSS